MPGYPTKSLAGSALGQDQRPPWEGLVARSRRRGRIGARAPHRRKKEGHRSDDSPPQPGHPPVLAETAKDRCPIRPV